MNGIACAFIQYGKGPSRHCDHCEVLLRYCIFVLGQNVVVGVAKLLYNHKLSRQMVVVYMTVTCGLSPALYFLGMKENQVSPLPETEDIQPRRSAVERDNHICKADL